MENLDITRIKEEDEIVLQEEMIWFSCVNHITKGLQQKMADPIEQRERRSDRTQKQSERLKQRKEDNKTRLRVTFESRPILVHILSFWSQKSKIDALKERESGSMVTEKI